MLKNQGAIDLKHNTLSLEGGIQEPIGKIASALHRYMQTCISRSLVNGRFGIGPGQLYVLLVVACNEGLCQKEITQQLMLEKATVAKAIKTLVNIGYVRTAANARDRRHIKVYLSEQGRTIMPSILLFLDEMNQIILEGFSNQEVQMAYSLLERMNHNLLKKLMYAGDTLHEDQQ